MRFDVCTIARAVEDAQRAFLSELWSEVDRSPADAAREMWNRLAAPELAPQERLFFELYARALHGRPGTEGFLDGVVTDWVDQSARLLAALGLADDEARSASRLGLAVVRGLLLDLLATGDRAGVDAAFERFLSLSRQ